MKLVSRKTRKAINKSVRKAIVKNAPVLVAAVASGLASAIATLGRTESPDRPGKSNLADMVDRAKDAVMPDAPRSRGRSARRGSHDEPADEQEGTRLTYRQDQPHPQAT